MRKMKDSGIEWIGEITDDWDICRIKYNTYLKGRIGWQGLKAHEFIDNGPYLVTGTDFYNGKIDWSKCYHITYERYMQAPDIHLKEGDLLITKDGTVGKLAYLETIPDKASLNSHLLLIRPINDLFSNKFLFWIFSSDIFKIYTGLSQNGTIMESLSQEKINNFSFPIPKFNIQNKIINYLDNKCSKLDSTIDREKQHIEKLKEYKQTVITEAVTKGLDPNVPMKDSGIEWIGKIPDSWVISKIKTEFKILDALRKPLNANERGDILGEYDYYGASGVIDKIGQYIFEETLLLIGEDGANLITRNLPIIYKATGKYWVNNHTHILRPLENNILSYWFFQLECVDLFNYISGSAQPKLTQVNLASIPVVVPTKLEQAEISNYLDHKTEQIDNAIFKKETLIEKLTEYKKSLIYEAVTGKLEIV